MNIVLIGMPASGKSTVGVVLAKLLGCDFIDTDLLIQRQSGLRLSEIIQAQGLYAGDAPALRGDPSQRALVASPVGAVSCCSGWITIRRSQGNQAYGSSPRTKL